MAITLGDPRGIGPEVVARALAEPRLADAARFVVVGPEGLDLPIAAPWPESHDLLSIGRWEGGLEEAGRVAGRAIDEAIRLALDGVVEGLVTAPISKGALAAAGYLFPGHTEFLQERCGAPEVAMIMAAEETPLGGPLRVVLLTVHVPLREVPALLTTELVVRRTRVAARALREWWGLTRPRLAFAGVNPHASEGGLFGDEEARILEPAARAIAEEEDVEVVGILPADTVFRRALDGSVDAVVVPYHDVGLAVLKTVAGGAGVNVTAGLPFPRTSPDHGTALDIAGRGAADPSSMIAAIGQCVRFCRRTRTTGA